MSNQPFIIFLDCGDTLIDESTEIRNNRDEVIQADLIPGAKTMVKALVAQGYRLALVADGLAQSFKNMLTYHEIYDDFEVMIYSECIKQTKPDPRMFNAAMGAMGLQHEDRHRIIMVGNNLKRDIKGANDAGITSVHLSWSPRYVNEPEEEGEKPDYTITEPMELLKLLDTLKIMKRSAL